MVYFLIRELTKHGIHYGEYISTFRGEYCVLADRYRYSRELVLFCASTFHGIYDVDTKDILDRR